MKRGDLVLVWGTAAIFVWAGLWRVFFDLSLFPLPALRYLVKGDDFSVLLQVSAVLGAAIYMSVRRWHTKESLCVFRGVSMALWIQGFIYIGVPFGLTFFSCVMASKRATPLVESKKTRQVRRVFFTF